MRLPLFLAAGTAIAALTFAARPAPAEPASASAAVTSIPTNCASCHALTRPDNPTVERLWSRKGPDLWYAGDKFNRDWLVSWLQNPTPIRPGGVMWFNHARPGEPRDTLDSASIEKHPAVDAATAPKLADALLQLKGDGLVTEGEFKAEGANLTMGKMAFGKLRGCIACHQDQAGQGGVSGPQLYDAGKRLRPDFVLAYTRDPQRFDRFIWMPRLTLSDPDLQRLTGYIESLGKENK
ncbi:MAG: cytochrome C [Sphingomonadales bacterium]|nr:MAG: cytochrome C [Sphingomonadales bacterium]